MNWNCMANITGFGKAEWFPMMGGVSFALVGTGAYVLIRPIGITTPQPWWPGEVGNALKPEELVTAELLLKAIPTLPSVVWREKPAVMANVVECASTIGQLRVHIVGHIHSNGIPRDDLIKSKHDELRQIGIEFIALLSQSHAGTRTIKAGNSEYFVSIRSNGSWWATLNDDNSPRILSAPSNSKPAHVVKASLGPSNDPDSEIEIWARSLHPDAIVIVN